MKIYKDFNIKYFAKEIPNYMEIESLSSLSLFRGNMEDIFLEVSCWHFQELL